MHIVVFDVFDVHVICILYLAGLVFGIFMYLMSKCRDVTCRLRVEVRKFDRTSYQNRKKQWVGGWYRFLLLLHDTAFSSSYIICHLHCCIPVKYTCTLRFRNIRYDTYTIRFRNIRYDSLISLRVRVITLYVFFFLWSWRKGELDIVLSHFSQFGLNPTTDLCCTFYWSVVPA